MFSGDRSETETAVLGCFTKGSNYRRNPIAGALLLHSSTVVGSCCQHVEKYSHIEY